MKVLIADDDQTIRLIGESLAHQKGVEIVSMTDGLGAREVLFDSNPPDVAILNCSLPHADGIELCTKLREQQTGSYTHMILVSNGNIKEVFSSLAGGFYNVLMKPLEQEELQDMITGISVVNDAPHTGAHQLPFSDPLTERQREILAELAQGYSNKEIAERLGISIGTIKSHIHQIFNKLSAGSRTKAVVKARQFGLI